jgi:two-component system sensor histidine kinase BaeS
MIWFLIYLCATFMPKVLYIGRNKLFISIRYKLFGTLLLSVVIVVVGMFFLVHWSFDRGFLNYVNTVEAKRLDSLVKHLQEAYADQGDWQFLQGNQRLWYKYLLTSTPDDEGQQFNLLEDIREDRQSRKNHHPPEEIGERRHGRNIPRNLRKERRQRFEFRVVLLDSNKSVVVGPRRHPIDLKLTPLKHEAQIVGYLGHASQKNLLADHQLKFVQKQKKSFALISFLIAALAALISFPVASRLVRRINALAAGTHHLAAGRSDTRLPEGPADELGQLTRDFNSLALTLAKNEQIRRQWVADISHELRTPLTVLRGELEALQDGVRQVTPESLASLHSEILRLGRLVDDLFQLSMSDIGALSYKKESVDAAKILLKAINKYQTNFAEKQIVLTADIPLDSQINVFGDLERLHQLFDNLLSNSLKYTDSGGELIVRCKSTGKGAEILFQDSTPGVPPADIDRLFERLFRVESSRNRASGGAGLGLAICKNIVEAHGGTIAAALSSTGGVAIRVNLLKEDKI